MQQIRFELPNARGEDHTKLRLGEKFPQPSKNNRLNKAPARSYDQPLLPGQTTTTGEGAISGYMDQRYNSNWRTIYGS